MIHGRERLRNIGRAPSELVNTRIVEHPELDAHRVSELFPSNLHELDWAIRDAESFVTRWDEAEQCDVLRNDVRCGS